MSELEDVSRDVGSDVIVQGFVYVTVSGRRL